MYCACRYVYDEALLEKGRLCFGLRHKILKAFLSLGIRTKQILKSQLSEMYSNIKENEKDSKSPNHRPQTFEVHHYQGPFQGADK